MGHWIFSQHWENHTYPGMEQAEYEGPLPLSILVQNPTGFTEQASDLGFHETGSFRSIIPIHWNDDGILDYWVTDVEKAPQLWTSDNCTTNNWLNIEAPNHTMIRIKAKGITWTGLVHGQSSYGANRSPHWHVGLGTVTELPVYGCSIPQSRLANMGRPPKTQPNNCTVPLFVRFP